MDYESLYKQSQKQVERLENQISELISQIALLNVSIVKLSRRLNQDSSNSGKPSSSNPYKN